MRMKHTIKQLRQVGYKVRVLHARHRYTKPKMDGSQNEVHARGGSTTIELTTPDKTQTVIGKSVCSLEDNYNRKVGAEIALGRALKQLEAKTKE
jgi:hypothetical protein